MFGIQVGVSINILVKSKQHRGQPARLLYHGEVADLNKERTFAFLDEKQHVGNVAWQELIPDKRHTWLTEGLHTDFDTFIPIGSKAAKASKGDVEGTLFKTYSLGVSTNRDAWVYNFNRNVLTENMQAMIEFYNSEVLKWEHQTEPNVNVEDFVTYDDAKIKWTDRLKSELKKGRLVAFSPEKMRTSLYRPFTKSRLYFDKLMNQRTYVLPSIFPTPETEKENRVICVPSIGGRADFWCYLANVIPNLTITAIDGNQCFPFYTYDEGRHKPSRKHHRLGTCTVPIALRG